MLDQQPFMILTSLYGQLTQGGTVNTIAMVWLTLAVLKLQSQMKMTTQTLAAFMQIFGRSHAGQPENVKLAAGD